MKIMFIVVYLFISNLTYASDKCSIYSGFYLDTGSYTYRFFANSDEYHEILNILNHKKYKIVNSREDAEFELSMRFKCLKSSGQNFHGASKCYKYQAQSSINDISNPTTAIVTKTNTFGFMGKFIRDHKDARLHSLKKLPSCNFIKSSFYEGRNRDFEIVNDFKSDHSIRQEFLDSKPLKKEDLPKDHSLLCTRFKVLTDEMTYQMMRLKWDKTNKIFNDEAFNRPRAFNSYKFIDNELLSEVISENEGNTMIARKVLRLSKSGKIIFETSFNILTGPSIPSLPSIVYPESHYTIWYGVCGN